LKLKAAAEIVKYRWYTTKQQQHPFSDPFSWLPGWDGTRKVKPVWIYWSKR